MSQDQTHPIAPIAVVGTAAIMPDAPDGTTFWRNITSGVYSISEVPPERWDPELYYDPDHAVPDKTYSRIGGWVREFPWDPIAWRLPIPPKVADQMDKGQRWAVSAARSALTEAGWPGWDVDLNRVAVIFGNAIGGEKHYQSSMRIKLPEVLRHLRTAPSLTALPADVQQRIVEETRAGYLAQMFDITEDTMPGELSNVIAGRVANLFNLRGPNFTTDAACASGLAALSAAVHGLVEHDFDAVVTGGIDANMGVDAFVKFCKIGALSATGTRPFDSGADGFVMGEGCALFVLKRLEDAEAAGDRIHAVILGVGGSSDGKGKGITAPNPVGQQLAVERAWASSGEDPSTATAVEAHGTSTSVGDAAELGSLTAVFGAAGAAPRSIALGSVKSNIGHLKAAAGTAGLFKMVAALREKQLPPSLNFVHPNENVDWDTVPFAVNTELRAWPEPVGGVRRAGVSAFGFGGTNFHVVVEEHVPGRHRPPARSFATASFETPAAQAPQPPASVVERPAVVESVGTTTTRKAPLRGALVLGARDDADLLAQVRSALADARVGTAPAPAAPPPATLAAPVRAAVDFADAADLAGKLDKLDQALTTGNPALFRMLRQQGAFVGRGPAPKVAFLYTGQGSQYVNMLAGLAGREPIVADTFAEADQVMTPLLGRPLTSYLFVDRDDAAAVRAAEQQLLQTEITQPAVLATDLALTRLLAGYGIGPDMVMGHSLGEYGALVAAGSLSFESALEAVSARGHEMASLTVEDNGAMAAVFGPLPEIERIVGEADGYVVIANINSNSQAVIGGATAAVERVVDTFNTAGINAVRIPVSHAFHTSIVAPASVPLAAALRRLDVRGPQLPCVANVTGEFYPTGADTETMLDLLGKQVASPVQFVHGLKSLYDAGARVFVEVGPKKALHGFVEDVLGDRDDVSALFTNHPKLDDAAAFNQALCGLYAAGLGAPAQTATTPSSTEPPMASDDTIHELGLLFAEVLEKGLRLYGAGTAPAATAPVSAKATTPAPVDVPLPEPAAAGPALEPVVITGAGLGLPGRPQVFGDDNVAAILAGQQFIGQLPESVRERMVDMRITRLVKSESKGASFATIDDPAEVIKLAGMHAPVDVVEQFGIDSARDEALDVATRLAIGAGLEALHDAGVPLVQRYKTTTLGTQLPDRWGLPEALRDDTGIVFASAFPGYERLVEAVEDYAADKARRDRILALEGLRASLADQSEALVEVDRLLAELHADRAAHPYEFDRRFLFRVLSMGHSQFAELIGARGPNTQVNAACASTTQALSVAEDWIRAGRCRRVIVVSADDATGERMLPWIGAGFLASGAAATDEKVEDAATPFDRRRHGMIIGMGAAAFVVESAEAARERGIQPICEVLGAVTANSAFHGTRLDVEHIAGVMESVVSEAERRGVDRAEIAPKTVFVSHETYTPARGGSASAEIHALRSTFGPGADRIVITNTKGFTGHAMGTGIEDVLAIKSLETGLVPAVPNYREPDPELGELNLSTGGSYPVEYALRLAAGFGSQIAMSLLRRTPMPDGARPTPQSLGYGYRIVDPQAWQHWLDSISGHRDARLEVDHRRLRVVDVGAPAVPVAVPTQVPVPYAAAPVTPVEAPGAPESDGVAASAAQAPPPPAPVVESVEAVSGVDAVLAEVTAVVAEMTGYPSELLDPDLDLEADLGVDTVKQAEVFAAVREHYGLERDENLQLRDFPTLNSVAGWVRSKTGAPEPVVESVEAVASVGAVSGVDAVLAEVTAVVAEMTGYPSELLDPDLDLEADLGVDTVKQAEVFAAVREHYGLERDENLQLRDFPTLNSVAGWVRSKTGAPEPGASGGVETPTVAAPQPPGVAPDAPSVVHGDLAATDALPRRIPVPSLRPPAGDCVETGLQLDGARVLVMPDEGGVGAALVKRLEKAGATAHVLDPATTADELTTALDGWLAEGRVDGVYWLPALDDEGDPAEADAWSEALRRRVKSLYLTMRRLWEDSPFLVAATRLGGYHGYDAAGATSPMGGAVTGFTKSYKKERPEALVKAVDFPAGRKTAALADQLVEETLVDPGCVEIGRVDGLRFGIAFREVPFTPLGGDGSPLGEGGTELTADSVVVVTGAAGSIVSAITADLAAASGATFHLLDLTPAPDAADADLTAYRTDREGLKTTLMTRMKDRGERPTPVAIERELAGLERREAALTAIESVRAAGGTAVYHCVDLTDPAAVAEALTDVGDRVDLLLHAAGLEISRNLPDKEPREFDLVFDVKVNGWRNVWSALRDAEVGAVVVFSSVAGRFGNNGQTDYAAANDLLCKTVSSLRRTRPQTRALALDWTAWGGIGMATRGSIPKIMELAGVQMLPAEAGVAWIRRELASGPWSGEVIVAGQMGMMAAEYHPTGGLATPDVADRVMVDEARLSVHEGLVTSVTLDPEQQPFLDHHRIEGTPVLPGVMGMEAFTEAAGLLAPEGYAVRDVEQVSFLAPVKFYRDEPRTLRMAVTTEPDGPDLVAHCALTAERTLPGHDEPVRTLHFTGAVRLSGQPAEQEQDACDQTPGEHQLTPEQVYSFYFHGPAYQVVDAAWRHDGEAVARLAPDLPVDRDPADARLSNAPRLVELCFQAAGLWQAGRDGQLALPMAVERVSVLDRDAADAAGDLVAVARQTGEASFDARVVSPEGRVVVRLEGYHSTPVPMPIPDDVAGALRQAFSD